MGIQVPLAHTASLGWDRSEKRLQERCRLEGCLLKASREGLGEGGLQAELCSPQRTGQVCFQAQGKEKTSGMMPQTPHIQLRGWKCSLRTGPKPGEDSCWTGVPENMWVIRDNSQSRCLQAGMVLAPLFRLCVQSSPRSQFPQP